MSAQGFDPVRAAKAEADTQLTSCSLETPPKNSATRSLEFVFIKEDPLFIVAVPLGHSTSLQLIIITYYALRWLDNFGKFLNREQKLSRGLGTPGLQPHLPPVYPLHCREGS